MSVEGIFRICVVSLLFLSGMMGGVCAMDKENDGVIVPAPLKAGDTVAIVAPAGRVREGDVEAAAEIMRSHGWVPVIGRNALGREGTYSGTDVERYADVRDAVLDESVRAIVCARGGYGVVHLLDSLDALPWRENAKWVVGFSDISALHALLRRHGVASVHGPMCRYISADGGDNDDARELFGLLEGDRPDYVVAPHEYNREGTATGVLTGGNLAVLTGLVGTPYDVFRPGTVLVIEDVNEPIYKVERMLYQLRLSGVLSRLAGLIVGQFTHYSADDNYESMECMIRDMVSPYGYPVAFDVPIGHNGHCMPLIESVPVTLTVTADGVSIRQ